MHAEVGFIRKLPNSNKVEFLVSHPFGVTGNLYHY